MSSKLEFKGMDELRRALRQLPEELTHEARVIVEANAEEAQRQLRVAYPLGPSGRLRGGVTTEKHAERAVARAVVRSRAPHANLWEQVDPPKKRHTSQGWNRGTMRETPENQKMIPIAIRRRRVMVHALVDLVRRAGFQVNDSNL